MFCKFGIIDLGILSTSKIWEHVEISEDVEISEHVEISDHEEMSYTLFVFVIIHEKFCFVLIFMSLEISESIEISKGVEMSTMVEISVY